MRGMYQRRSPRRTVLALLLVGSVSYIAYSKTRPWSCRSQKWEELKAWRREKVDGFKAWKKIADERYVRRRDRYEKQIEAVHEPMKEHARSIWQGGMEKAKTQSRVVKDKLDEFRGRGEMLEVEDPKPRGGMRDRGVSSDKEAGE